MAHAPRNPNIPDRDGVSPSCVATPGGHWPLALDFLAERHPNLPREVWAERMATGWVWGDDAQPVLPHAAFTPHTRLYYWRQSPTEPTLPWPARVLYQDAHLVVADKPHFMPVTPSGPFVQNSLLVQLKRELGLPELSPIHRIDRDTAGLVLFAVQASERAAYQTLFRDRLVRKRYEAVAPWADLAALAHAESLGMSSSDGGAGAPVNLALRTATGTWSPLAVPLWCAKPGEPAQPDTPLAWRYRSRLESDAHFFTMHERPGEANSETHIQLLDRMGHWGRYLLVPHTGKRHQLRAHLSAMGVPMRHDPYYPTVSRAAQTADDWTQPLQLLASQLAFEDPFSGQLHAFESQLRLQWPPMSANPAPMPVGGNANCGA